ncbi:hypothetical protein BBJ28_00015526 [Nothophytophthora sp. Chile5]|nr:hypothetical protein BBJ28_00015526 [Nothophytophthora sp. Chile5]
MYSCKYPPLRFNAPCLLAPGLLLFNRLRCRSCSAPIMGSMAAQISDDLDGDLSKVVPTTIMMVALTSVFLGSLFLCMGAFRITFIANYVPYPVIAGFLSGIGLQLMNNGLHMSSPLVFTRQVFTLQQLLLLFPALSFVTLARVAQHRNWAVALSFPSILIVSFVSFHIVTFVCGVSTEELQTNGWIFEWSAPLVAQSPMWHPWTSIDFGLIEWGVLAREGVRFTVPLVILGAIKYSVAATSLSTVFSRDISADNEMKVVGWANLLCGALGSCGGCHYLPAMGIMKQIAGHEKVPALVCSTLLLLLWVTGIQMLELVPKFIFGGLLLSVGMKFLDSFFTAPLKFLKPAEIAVLGFITSSFLVIGMLESVALGTLISMIELLYHIHQVGCIYLEATGAAKQSTMVRSPEELMALQIRGGAIFILRLQGFLVFGTSAKIVKRIERCVQSLEPGRVRFVVLDFELVPNVDARAVLNLRKVLALTDQFDFDVYLCGLTPQIETRLTHNHTDSSRVHFQLKDFDSALRTRILESESRAGDSQERRRMHQQLRTFKSQIDELKSNLQRSQLMDGSQQRQQANDPNDELGRIDDHLGDAQGIIARTEATAQNVDETREDTSEAGLHLKKLKCKMFSQIVLLYLVILGLVIVIIWRVISKFA